MDQETKKQIIEPEIEKFEEGKVIEKEDKNNYISDKELDDIKSDPYTYICEFYEKMYPRVGRKVFSLLSLVPASILLPKIDSEFKQIKQKLSLLWISSSGSGKTSIAYEFNRIAYNPMITQSITPARLVYEIEKRSLGEEIPKISIIVSDIAQLFSNEEFVKLLEGVIGDESEMSRATMKNKKKATSKQVDCVGYLSGTYRNVFDAKVRDGILGRTSSLLTFFSEEDNKFIVEHVNSRMGKPLKNHSIDIIKIYYDSLYNIQLNKNDEIKPIQGYIFPKEIIDQVGEFILSLKPLKENLKRWGLTSVRPLEQIYRFMVNSAFLNIYNRKVINDNGVYRLVIEYKDFEIAKRLAMRESIHTFRILKTIEIIDKFNIQNERDLREFETNLKKSNHKLSDDVINLMKERIKN